MEYIHTRKFEGEVEGMGVRGRGKERKKKREKREIV